MSDNETRIVEEFVKCLLANWFVYGAHASDLADDAEEPTVEELVAWYAWFRSADEQVQP